LNQIIIFSLYRSLLFWYTPY